MLLTDLNGQIHSELSELLLQHLEALTALDIETAHTLWQRFCSVLESHSKAEDQVVIPAYERLGNFPEGGKPSLFTAEHTSIHRLLSQISEQLTRLLPGAPQLRREMVLSLDRYMELRRLLEHHTLREQNLLYPTLDANAGETTKTAAHQILETANLKLQTANSNLTSTAPPSPPSEGRGE